MPFQIKVDDKIVFTGFADTLDRYTQSVIALTLKNLDISFSKVSCNEIGEVEAILAKDGRRFSFEE